MAGSQETPRRPDPSKTRVRRLGVALLLLSLGFAWGFATSSQRTFPYSILRGVADSLASDPLAAAPAGWWKPARRGGKGGVPSETVEALEALGYASGYEAAAYAGGVRLHDADASYGGLNLYTAGHAPAAVLMDMQGRTLHTWQRDYAGVWPGEVPGEYFGRTDYWRRVRLLAGGELLAVFEGHGLVRLDRDSNVVWAHRGGEHHDVEVDERGRIWTLAREPRSVPDFRDGKSFFDDVVRVLGPGGDPLREISIFDALEHSDYASLLSSLAKRSGYDIFHANSLQVLDGRHAAAIPAFASGNVLLSLRTLDLVAVLDPVEERFVWAITGMWRLQHEPVLLESGRLLVFDNEGYGGYSRVLELDPLTQEIVWQYAGDEQNGFHSKVCGSNQRLPNGNTLIVESTAGRAFEVAPDGRIVWDFVNPHRAGENRELVAVLMDLVRLPAKGRTAWLSP